MLSHVDTLLILFLLFFMSKGILVEPLDAVKAIKSYTEKVEKFEDHEQKGNFPLIFKV